MESNPEKNKKINKWKKMRKTRKCIEYHTYIKY